MQDRFSVVKLAIPSLTLASALAVTPLAAQDTVTVVPSPIAEAGAPLPGSPMSGTSPVASGPVQEAQIAAPPPILPPVVEQPNDRIAPQAQAAMEQERTAAAQERVANRRTETAAKPRMVATSAPVRAAPVTENQITEEMPTTTSVNTAADAADPAFADVRPSGAESANVSSETVTDGGMTEEWLLAAGIIGGLGLAGAAVAARRRRRSNIALQEEPVWSASPAYAEPADPAAYATAIPRPEVAPKLDPLFARSPAVQDAPSDPLFRYQPPAIPVTDPLFANSPDYVGPGSRRVEQPKGEPVTAPASAHSPERERILVPAE